MRYSHIAIPYSFIRLPGIMAQTGPSRLTRRHPRLPEDSAPSCRIQASPSVVVGQSWNVASPDEGDAGPSQS